MKTPLSNCTTLMAVDELQDLVRETYEIVTIDGKRYWRVPQYNDIGMEDGAELVPLETSCFWGFPLWHGEPDERP